MQTRRQFMQTTGAVAGALSLSCDGVTEPQGDKGPNVLIIMCDQLNAGVLGCYGGPVPTPHLDRLAAGGVLFEDAVCPLPVCSPSRASFITGKYPHQHGITHNVSRIDYPAIGGPASEEGIKSEDVTTESLLHAAGYRTHHYGKWHLMGDDLPYYNDWYREHHEYAADMAKTFAQVRQQPGDTWMNWYDWALPVEQTSAFQQCLSNVGTRWDDKVYAEFITKMGRLELPPEQNFDVMVTDHAVETIRRQDASPFMITCSLNAPHDPNVITSPWYEMFNPDALEIPANADVRESWLESSWSREIVRTLGEPALLEFLRIYYAMVAMVDDQVGRMLNALEESGKAEDTLVIFTADHGDMAGGHGMVWKSNGSFYDEVARVPLIIRYPRHLKPHRSRAAADHTDIMPTILEFCRQPIPKDIAGHSLRSVLMQTPESQRLWAFCERKTSNPQHTRRPISGNNARCMIRGGGWKYCWYGTNRTSLYHLNEDPGECRNLIGIKQYQNVEREMKRALAEWQRETTFPEDGLIELG
jgi:arylsulfatase A-like enzyme